MPPKKVIKPLTFKKPELKDTGFTRLRRGIWQHVRDGRITGNDFCVYNTLLEVCNWRTGICTSSAPRLLANWGNFSEAKHKVRQFQNALYRLREAAYIDYPVGDGTVGSFPILINKYDVTLGKLRGWRLRLLAGEPGSSDFRNPTYEWVSETPWSECYGVPKPPAFTGVWRGGLTDALTGGLTDDWMGDLTDDLTGGLTVAVPVVDVLKIYNQTYPKIGSQISSQISFQTEQGSFLPDSASPREDDDGTIQVKREEFVAAYTDEACPACELAPSQCECPYECETCSGSWTGLGSFRGHLLRNHADEISELSKEEIEFLNEEETPFSLEEDETTTPFDIEAEDDELS